MDIVIQQSAILKADRDKEAAYRQAGVRERLVEAEAQATDRVAQAIAQGDVNAINYFVAQKYTGALTQIASAENQKSANCLSTIRPGKFGATVAYRDPAFGPSV